MSTLRARIERLMDKEDACWYLSKDKFVATFDPWDSHPTYHVHPDRSCPHQDMIRRFDTLQDILQYLQGKEPR